MTGLVAVCASGRFVSRYTFATILIVSVVVLAPTPAPLHPGLRILVAVTTASLFSCEWGAVALAERVIRRRVLRGAVVLATLVVSSLTRPTVQDAVSVALGAPVPPPGAELLRAATNLAVWTLALGGTALLVEAARATRQTNTLLRTVLAQLQSSAVRARTFAVEARTATMRAAALIREPLEATSDGARLRAAMLRTAAHDLHALADRGAAAMAAENPGVELPSREQVLTAYEHLRHRAVALGVARDIGFRLPTIWVAEGHCRVAPVWLYRFDHAAPFLHLIGLGATHASELPYLWGNLVSGPKDLTFRLGGLRVAEDISSRMQLRWSAFAHGGEPSASTESDWPAYDVEARTTLVIDRRDRVVDDLDADLRRAWGDDVLTFH